MSRSWRTRGGSATLRLAMVNVLSEDVFQEGRCVSTPDVHASRAAEAVRLLVLGSDRRIDLPVARLVPALQHRSKHLCRAETRVLRRLQQEHGNIDAIDGLFETRLQVRIVSPVQRRR